MDERQGAASSFRERIVRIDVRGVVKRFGATVALRGVDATFVAGRMTLIEGPNGSGKSTLLGVLGTLVRSSAGEVKMQPGGVALATIRAEIGWVSHESLAYGDLSGRQNIELAASIHGLDPREAWLHAAERFELGAFATRPVRTNSRGQRQRVALARALVHAPSVLLLDEPTTGLDLAGVSRLLGILHEETDAVVIVVTHESERFEAFEPRRIVLERGRVVAADPVTTCG